MMTGYEGPGLSPTPVGAHDAEPFEPQANVIFLRVCQFLAINAHKMAPRTG